MILEGVIWKCNGRDRELLSASRIGHCLENSREIVHVSEAIPNEENRAAILRVCYRNGTRSRSERGVERTSSNEGRGKNREQGANAEFSHSQMSSVCHHHANVV